MKKCCLNSKQVRRQESKRNIKKTKVSFKYFLLMIKGINQLEKMSNLTITDNENKI
jgi:hypothetical protein